LIGNLGGETLNLHLIKRIEIGNVASLCASSFMNDPLFVFFFPNSETRQKKATWFFKAQLMMCQSFTYVLQDLNGVIIIQKPSDKTRSPSIKQGILLMMSVGLGSILKALSYQRYSKKVLYDMNLKEMDHLVLICVDEKDRNKGVAKDMIQQVCLSKTILETQNSDNIHFYQKLGFKLEKSSAFKSDRKLIIHFILTKDIL
jgi:ribosomal protein S18 acetylase RimI-like enzyme